MVWLVSLALADTERLTWAVTWMGVQAGTAWSTRTTRDATETVEAGCRSAPWLAALYPIDDVIRSVWRVRDGAVRYETQFREGAFQQDEVVDFSGERIRTSRRLWKEGAWTHTEQTYAQVPTVEDPVSGFYRTRASVSLGAPPLRFKVWTGRWASDVVVQAVGVETIDGARAWRVEIASEHADGDVEPRATLWLSADDGRVPLRVDLRTRAGPVRVTLLDRTVTP